MSRFSLCNRPRDSETAGLRDALCVTASRHCEARSKRSSPDNQLKPWIASSFLLAMTRSGKSPVVKNVFLNTD